MYQTTIINPKTNRSNKAVAWKIEPRKIVDDLKAGKIKSAKDISWSLLNDDQSYELMEETQYGDSNRNNFALSVFENALDWGLGITVLNYITSVVKQHKAMPKPFEVIANRSGDVFIRTFSGKVI